MSSVFKYRPELDGIRALAVIAVIIFHLNPNWLPGGFVGVDVFFALSGYLITSIIIREKDLESFSVKAFYIRRMKRILPPLYFMVAVTIFVGACILVPKDFFYLKESVHYLLAFCSNLYFGKGGDYFGPQAGEIPLLHTWSLAIEEQFYFFWPAILGLVYRFDRKRKGLYFALAVIGSFVYAEYLLKIQNNRQLAYYSLMARYGEMLLGSGLAILNTKESSVLNSLRKNVRGILSYTGILLLLFSFIFLSENSYFPGVNSLLPVMGTLLLIVGMTDHDGIISRILSNFIFNHFGKISYSLYLWHWPVLAYMRYAYGSSALPYVWLTLAVALTYLFSVLSYSLIEKKVRNLRMGFSKTVTTCLVIPSFLLFFGLAIGSKNSVANNENPVFTKYGGDEVCHFKVGSNCIRGERAKEPNILIFGDSHAAHLHHFIEQLGKLNGWSAMLVSASSCGPAFGLNVEFLPVNAREDCKALLDYVQKNFSKYDTIVIAARWDFQLGIDNSPYNDPGFINKFEETLKVFKGEGKRVLVVSQVPSLSSDPFRAEKAVNLGIPVVIKYSDFYKQANSLLVRLAQKNNIEVMNVTTLVHDLEGGINLNGRSVYMDNNHLNAYGSASLAEQYFRGENLLR